jgi:nudix-type nucleoside diphosphatase (YffH/AdpP family)
MSYFGEKSEADIRWMFPMIRSRAWSQMNARHGRHGAGTLLGYVDVAARKRSHAQYFALDMIDVVHERFDGTRSVPVAREVFVDADAVIVLPYDPVRDRVLLVEQIRMGPIVRGDPMVWQLEPIAGRVDPGEAPENTARREALEEAGLTLAALHPVAESYCSPGNSTAFYYVYLGLCDLPDGTAGHGGLASEDEDIRSHLMDYEALMKMCDSQRTANAPLALAAYWLARHRDRLRAMA